MIKVTKINYFRHSEQEEHVEMYINPRYIMTVEPYKGNIKTAQAQIRYSSGAGSSVMNVAEKPITIYNRSRFANATVQPQNQS